MPLLSATGDNFYNHYQDSAKRGAIDWPYVKAVLVTPNNDVDLTFVTRALFVGVTGDVEVVTAAGDQVTFRGIAAGTLLPMRVRRVKSDQTTADGILALE